MREQAPAWNGCNVRRLPAWLPTPTANQLVLPDGNNHLPLTQSLLPRYCVSYRSSKSPKLSKSVPVLWALKLAGPKVAAGELPATATPFPPMVIGPPREDLPVPCLKTGLNSGKVPCGPSASAPPIHHPLLPFPTTTL